MADARGTADGSWWQRHRRPALAGSVGGGLVVFGLVWWLVPLLLYRSGGTPDALLTAVVTTRAALLAGFVGLGALGTLWVSIRSLRITAQTAEVTARTFEVTQQGHLTDRYTKAIGQIGDDKLDVRLGGIYALERLAVDSERDHPTVVEVLSAFVRERCKPPQVSGREKSSVRLATDVQAALTVLGRLPARDGVSRGDLIGTHLPNAVLATAERWTGLVGANLAGVNFSGANLTQAMLAGANLEAVGLDGADLTGAVLAWSNMTGARLMGANLTGALMNYANLTDANLALANLTDANLKRVKLVGVKGLTQAQVNSALGSGETSLPEGLTQPASWADLPDYDFPSSPTFE